MTIEIKVPAHSDKKFYEEKTNVYEQKKAANVFKMGGLILEDIEDLEEGKKLVHVAGDTNGHHAKVYHLTGQHDEGDPYHVRLFHGKNEHKPAEYFTDDLEDAKGTAEDMAKRAMKTESVDLDEATAAARTIKGKKLDASDVPVSHHLPHGMTGDLARLFGVPSVNPIHPDNAPTRPNNDRTDQATQQIAKVATPDDLAVKLHASLPGMTRKAISLAHIVAALKAGVKAGDVQRLSHSAVGRKNLRSYHESTEVSSQEISEMMDAWTVELVQEGVSHKYIIRDEEDIIAEGVNLTSDAALKSAARAIEELGASMEEQVASLREEKEHASEAPARLLQIVRSLINK